MRRLRLRVPSEWLDPVVEIIDADEQDIWRLFFGCRREPADQEPEREVEKIV